MKYLGSFIGAFAGVAAGWLMVSGLVDVGRRLFSRKPAAEDLDGTTEDAE